MSSNLLCSTGESANSRSLPRSKTGVREIFVPRTARERPVTVACLQSWGLGNDRFRRNVAGAFLSAASPGVISLFFRNDHYANQEAYLFAIAEAMRGEYEAIAAAGVTLQIDCPDLAMGRHIQYANLSVEDFRKRARLHIE